MHRSAEACSIAANYKKITEKTPDMDYNNQSQYRKYAIYGITPMFAYNGKLSLSLSVRKMK